MKRTNQPYPSPNLLNKTIPNRSAYVPKNNTAKSKTPTKKHKWSFKKKALSTVLVILALFIGVSSWFGLGVIGNLDKLFHGNLFSDVSAFFSTTHLKGENSGRVNILLAGWQGKNSDEGDITDSIMVVSIDTKNNTAFVFSIPRDLWVYIPGLGYQKINDANDTNSFNKPGYFSGGMGRLEYVVETDFHIPIDYYALIDYNAFEDVVNDVGGITVDIQSPDPRGLYDPNVNKAHGGPLKLPNGYVHLNGIHALALALARGDSPYAYGFPLSDINRTQHQRQELIALEKKASSLGVLTNPITISNIVRDMGNNVKTDLSLSDAIRLAHIVHAINSNNIKSYGLSYSGNGPADLLTTYNAPDGEDALIPRLGINQYSQIQAYYQQLTSSN